MQLLSLALRNTLRNPRRTLLILVAFATGVAALVFAWSVFDGSNAQMIGTMAGNYTGYIQIHSQGYKDDPSVDRAFDAQNVLTQHLKEIAGIVAASPRMETLALVSSTENSRGLILVGIDPTLEPSVTALHQKITAGRYLSQAEKGGILLGKPLAKVLGVSVGSEVAVLTQGMQGSIGAQRYNVQGLYSTQNDMVDSLQAFISIADARELLSSRAQSTTTVAIKLDDRDRTDATMQSLIVHLGGKVEVEGWKQLLPEVAQSIDFHEAVGKLVTFILFGIVAIGVANTVLMSVTERLREFGVMMAIGTSSQQVFRIIMYEGLILGLLGFTIGLTIGYMLVSYFGSIGLALTQDPSAQLMQGIAQAIYPHLSVDRMLYISTAVLLVIVVASLYPAWKVAKMLPLQAIHGIAQRATACQQAQSTPAAFSSRFPLLMLAWRNLGRQPQRTRLTLAAVAFGLGAFIFIGSIANGFYIQIVSNATGMVTGDAQIQHKDFKDDMKPALALDNGMQLLEQVRHVPGVIGASPRVQAMAMVTSPAKSLPVSLIGVDPAMERRVTFLHKSVKEGNYLRQGYDREIVIGRRLGELLQVRIGEKLVVMVQDIQGNLNSEAFVVAGMFYTGSHSFDDVMAQITLPAAQKMLGMSDRITNIALHMQGEEEQVLPILQQVNSIIPPGDIRLLAWQKLVPAVAQMNVIFKRSLSILLAIVLLMVSVVTMNTVVMSVMERTREFGTMLALGCRPRTVLRLVQLESCIMGFSGTLGGLALGIFLTLLHMNGVNVKMHGASIPGVTNIIYPQLSLLVLTVPGVLLPILILLAALYPALRASRLNPVVAIRHV